MGWLRFLSFYDAATALLGLVGAAIASLSRDACTGTLPCLGLVARLLLRSAALHVRGALPFGAWLARLLLRSAAMYVRDSLPFLTWLARLLLRSAAMHVRDSLPFLGLVGAAIASLSRVHVRGLLMGNLIAPPLGRGRRKGLCPFTQRRDFVPFETHSAIQGLIPFYSPRMRIQSTSQSARLRVHR